MPSEPPKDTGFATRAVHAGERTRHPDAIPVASPITPSVSYLYDSAVELDAVLGGEHPGPVYARYGTPTSAALETAIAALESAGAALAVGSGMAAIHLALLSAGVTTGSSVVAAQDSYGGSRSLLTNILASQGVTSYFVDMNDLEALESVLKDTHPTAVLVETISNPLLKVANVPAIAERAHALGAEVIVDATFTTPWLYRPLETGADYVIHSATKYLGGHGDVTGGVIAADQPRIQRAHELLKLVGSILGPQEAWLILRGLKTLPLRMQRHCENALAIARWLEGHPRVRRVYYPGLPSHPQHELASQLFGDRGYGGVVSFELAQGGRPGVFRFLEALRLILPATSLGDVYSLASYPAMSSHRSLSPEERSRLGISDDLIRLSVGIEDVEDIQADLDQALYAASKSA
ncbi:MAG: aminotransferase class I/II-fold pyridoxal phosphate-dependent enzyme [Anaerolineae bacterium]|nr:aminotransferase class I/II-fold pyridoxal phosphate-dependent enzyme [Anaerolineae bacterium]